MRVTHHGVVIVLARAGASLPRGHLRSRSPFVHRRSPTAPARSSSRPVGAQHPRSSIAPAATGRVRERTTIPFPLVVRGTTTRSDRVRCATASGHKLRALRVPGHPLWHLAPREIGVAANRSGGYANRSRIHAQRRQTLTQSTRPQHDTLVAWAWAPRRTRERCTCTQASLAPDRRMIETGTACPHG